MHRTFHCLFEQSGTFKKEFIKMGLKAFDYDILNDFNETDYIVDIYDEIEKGYLGLKSIFDNISNQNGTILSFFPCTRFEAQILLSFRGDASQQKNMSLENKLSTDLKLHRELSKNYELITKLVIICIRKEIPMIFENPYSEQHYLTRYWCLKPKVIDKDRSANGDYFRKPTQYYFINCEPAYNLIFEPLEFVKTTTVDQPKIDGVDNKTVARSMIHPQYANRFIREYILTKEELKEINNDI